MQKQDTVMRLNEEIEVLRKENEILSKSRWGKESSNTELLKAIAEKMNLVSEDEV